VVLAALEHRSTQQSCGGELGKARPAWDVEVHIRVRGKFGGLVMLQKRLADLGECGELLYLRRPLPVEEKAFVADRAADVGGVIGGFA
jgi:hypothetical protein